MVLPPYDVEVLRRGNVTSLGALCMDGREFLQVLLVSSPRVLVVSPMYSSSHVSSPHWYRKMVPLFLSIGSLSLGLTKNCFKVLFPLKWVCIPYFLQIFLILSPRPWVYGMTMYPLLGLSLGAPSSCVTASAVSPFFYCAFLDVTFLPVAI